MEATARAMSAISKPLVRATEPLAAVPAVDTAFPSRAAHVPAGIDRLAGLADGAVFMLASEEGQARMRGGPGAELQIDLLQEVHITDVVPLHQRPRLGIARHAAEPQVGSRMRQLPAQLEVAAEVVKPVGVELEMSSGALKGVDRLVGARGP